MSVYNQKGAMFAILNDKGHYDIYSADGHPVKALSQTIRITQRADSLDQIVIIGIVNVVQNKEEMDKIINP